LQSCGSAAAVVAEAEHAHAAEEAQNTKGSAYLGALIATFIVSIASVAGACSKTHPPARTLFGPPHANNGIGACFMYLTEFNGILLLCMSFKRGPTTVKS
jgi:hypothetical protein